jgi:hypothetical protein
MKKKVLQKKKLEISKFTVCELNKMNKINGGKLGDGTQTPETTSNFCDPPE